MARSRHWCVLLLTAGVACGKRTAARENVPEDQALVHKAEGYVQCHETHSAMVLRLARVFRTAGAETLPAAFPDPKPCLEAIAAAKQKLPAAPALDAAGDAYGTALTTVHQLVTSPKRTAPELQAAFEAFERAQPALFDQLFAINRSFRLAQYAKQKAKEGRSLGVLVEELQLRAEDLVRFAATPVAQLDQMDAAAYSASLAQLERCILEIEIFAAQNPTAAEAMFQLADVLETANKLAITGRELARRATDKVAFSDAEKVTIDAGNESNVAGTPGALAVAYNKFVQLQ